jgi:hypothetical protein
MCERPLLPRIRQVARLLVLASRQENASEVLLVLPEDPHDVRVADVPVGKPNVQVLLEQHFAASPSQCSRRHRRLLLRAQI